MINQIIYIMQNQNLFYTKIGRKKDKLEKIHKSIQTLGYAKMISFSQEDKLNEKLFKMCEKESRKIED